MAKPIFCATHPRACSTAFERVFLTRNEDLTCIHEPFGDAFYFGPERMSSRYENDEKARQESGFAESTYKTIFDRIENEGNEGKRLFIKDMFYYLIPPHGKAAQLAPSLMPKRRGIGTNGDAPHINGASNGISNGVSNGNGVHNGAPFPYGTDSEPENPMVVPEELLKQFHYTFLIRDPHSSVPSFYRCTVPPKDEITGFFEYYPSEAGYEELREGFDYLVQKGFVGLKKAINGIDQQNGHQANGTSVNGGSAAEICVVDADDLLDNPEGIIKEFCRSTGLEYDPQMLVWDNEEDQTRAQTAFEKWKGWHDDALDSKDLKPRNHKKAKKSEADWDAEWTKRYGPEGAQKIRETVDKNMDDYLYLKQYAMKV